MVDQWKRLQSYFEQALQPEQKEGYYLMLEAADNEEAYRGYLLARPLFCSDLKIAGKCAERIAEARGTTFQRFEQVVPGREWVARFDCHPLLMCRIVKYKYDDHLFKGILTGGAK